MVSDQNASQSINISGGQMSNVQIGGQAGGDLNITQSQQIGDDFAEKQLSPTEVITLLDQLKQLIEETNLPASDKEKALRNIDTTKDEVQADEPDKKFAVKNLQRATKVLKEAGETVEAGTNLWQKVTPILETVSPWLGVAASFLI